MGKLLALSWQMGSGESRTSVQSVESPDIGKTPARGILLYLLYRFDFGDIVWPRGVRSLRIEAMQIMGLGEQKTIASNIGSEDQNRATAT